MANCWTECCSVHLRAAQTGQSTAVLTAPQTAAQMGDPWALQRDWRSRAAPMEKKKASPMANQKACSKVLSKGW